MVKAAESLLNKRANTNIFIKQRSKSRCFFAHKRVSVNIRFYIMKVIIRLFYSKRAKKKILYGIISLLLILFYLSSHLLEPVFQVSYTEAIYYIDTKDKIVSFTFDVTMGEKYIEDILIILDYYNIKSTFFLTGKWLEEYPFLAKEIFKKHEIGNYSYSYTALDELTDEELFVEFQQFREAFQNVFAANLVKYFRPPFGTYDERVLSLAGEEGQLTILWCIEGKGWLVDSVNDFVNDIITKVHPGAIIAFRASSSEIVMTLPVIIETLWEKNYEIVSLKRIIENSGRRF